MAVIAVASCAVSCAEAPTAPGRMVTVEGAITNREGSPLADVEVLIYPPAPPKPSQLSRAFTNEEGEYRLLLAAGTYSVRISPNYRIGIPAVYIPSFEAKGNRARLDYRFTGSRITGTITGPGGVSLPLASVSAISLTQQTSAQSWLVDGRYSLLLPPGAYRFSARSGDPWNGLPVTGSVLVVSSRDSVMNITLTGNRVVATVAFEGTALAGAVVLGRGETPYAAYAAARTGLDGTAVLYLPSGDYTYEVTPPLEYIAGPETGGWSISGDAALAVNFDRIRWDITVRHSTDGSVIPSARVDAYEVGHRVYATATTDPLGRCRILPRSSQAYAIRIGIPAPNYYTEFPIPNVSSTADSTFDLLVDIPAP